ncbi:39S ribosomal protein L18, mitochondrial isoform X2 [Dromiciops gliroides]|uniref:39S ribosomal protein L18, mitochondrial isoform X2 n=1 Tax=Dromiciops gliroides TaxID=33562 RepID=UPI001CC47197|nr:39S ribosomal protein L18, mitochondrial isoform X2 [Dromiciops gliroides]
MRPTLKALCPEPTWLRPGSPCRSLELYEAARPDGFPGGHRRDGAAGAGPGPLGSMQEARLRVQRTQHHIEAFVEHHNGNVVVSASTREWAIKKHLYRTRSVNACENIGRVLAQRCLEAGINFMVFHPTPWESSSESIQQLQNAMKEGGVVLQEPRRIYE